MGVCVLTGAGEFCAGVPSGASAGAGEAVELRDGGKKFGGLGVAKAAANVSGVINPQVIGMGCRDQEAVDRKMREIGATPNKSRLGGNAMCGVSRACARATAGAQKKPLYEHIAKLAKNKKIVLPKPCFNVISGGVHAGNDLDFQEFMV